MQNEYATPINHTAVSAAASTASGAAGGAISGGLKIGAGWLAATVGIGAAIGLAIFTGGGSLLASGALWAAIGGGAAGAAVGLLGLPYVAGAGAVLGGIKGGSRASDSVAQERAAAATLSAQVEVLKAQAMAQSAAYAPRNSGRSSYMSTASTMVGTPTRIQAGNDNVQYDGRMQGEQLAAAR